MKANKQNKNEKEVSIVYGDDNSINVNINAATNKQIMVFSSMLINFLTSFFLLLRSIIM